MAAGQRKAAAQVRQCLHDDLCRESGGGRHVKANRLERRPAIANDLPTTLYLETTNRCDSKCQTCIRTFTTLEPPADLTLERLVRVVEQHPPPKGGGPPRVGGTLLTQK